MMIMYRTLFDVQNVWGRTTVDTQKPVDSSPLAEIPRQDVSRLHFADSFD
jgi:hypothetical protein